MTIYAESTILSVTIKYNMPSVIRLSVIRQNEIVPQMVRPDGSIKPSLSAKMDLCRMYYDQQYYFT
jgi:hypothetical protein